jgi:Transposase DDE domain
MHAMEILHRTLIKCCPEAHARRLASLLAAVEAVVLGSRLALSDLGRGLRGRVAIKHNIKRVDRLLGNVALHVEAPQMYEALVRQCLAGVKLPLIIVDWSDLAPDRRWQLLRASVALEGRSVTLYEQVHPQSQSASPKVHASFLARLGAMLPPGCVPILITDAGFRGPWFRLVDRLGWYWIGRIRNRDMVKPLEGETWDGCKALYARATTQAQALGEYEYVRSHPVACGLVLVKHPRRGRHNFSVHGKRVRSNQSHKQARCQREPWLLAVCPRLNHLSAEAVSAIYAQRMQIEEAFRDLKSERFGLGLNANRSHRKARLAVLLLIACLASFVLRLIGEVAKTHQLEFQFQSNTRRSRPVLSVISLGLLIVRKGLTNFPRADLDAALRRLRYDHPALQI